MNISELSIRRPVLATVLTIIILLFGLIGYNTCLLYTSGQPLKQIFFPLKVSLKSGHQQAFPKPPRTAQKLSLIHI